jgi:hypothetical protein
MTKLLDNEVHDQRMPETARHYIALHSANLEAKRGGGKGNPGWSAEYSERRILWWTVMLATGGSAHLARQAVKAYKETQNEPA